MITLNLDVEPASRESWRPKATRGNGELVIDLEKIVLTQCHPDGFPNFVLGQRIMDEYQDQPVLPAHLVDYLFDHQEEIPESWKKRKLILFLGTVYEPFITGKTVKPDDSVRGLSWDPRRHDGMWYRRFYSLQEEWGGEYDVATLA